jgi:hypothetical protein
VSTTGLVLLYIAVSSAASIAVLLLLLLVVLVTGCAWFCQAEAPTSQ